MTFVERVVTVHLEAVNRKVNAVEVPARVQVLKAALQFDADGELLVPISAVERAEHGYGSEGLDSPGMKHVVGFLNDLYPKVKEMVARATHVGRQVK